MIKHLWILSLVLFVLSLLLPVFSTYRDNSYQMQGAGLLLFGWIGIFAQGGICLSWFANPFFITAISSTKRNPVVSIVFGSLSIIIASSFLFGGAIIANEAGHTTYITKIEIGFWCWLSSMIVILFASIARLQENIKIRNES